MSVRIYAVLFGIAFIAVGILGFFPYFTPNGYLFNLFQVNQMHNIIHILTGILALIVSFNAYGSRMFFKIFGAIYLFLAILPLMHGNDLVLMQMNTADNVFHLVVGALAIYLGFGKPKTPESENL